MIEKFKSIDWDSGKYTYMIYEEMPVNKIIRNYTHGKADDLNEIFNILKEVIEDLKKEGK